MKIKKAKKSDLNQYVNLVIIPNRKYKKIINQKINFKSENIHK